MFFSAYATIYYAGGSAFCKCFFGFFRCPVGQANQGNIEPLACVIATNLKDTYKKRLDATSVV